MAGRPSNATLYVHLYKNMFEATDMLFKNSLANAFVKQELRQDFRTNRHYSHPKIARRQLARGHEVLSTMVHLLGEKPENADQK